MNWELNEERKDHARMVAELFALRRFRADALEGIKSLLRCSEWHSMSLDAALRKAPVDLRQLVRRAEGRAE